MSARELRVAQVLCSEAFAGLERDVATLASGLADRGCEVTVLGGPPRRMSAELSSSGAAWRRARGVAEALTGLAQLGGVDIVHAHMTHAELAATLARPRTRGHLVATRHFAAPRGARLRGRLAGAAIRRAIDVQLAPSEYVAAHIDGPCQVIQPGVQSTEDRDETRDPVVLIAQRLVREKCTDTALRAFGHSGLLDHGWRLEILGDGPERGPLESLAAELALSGSCIFHGWQDDLLPHLRTASIMLAPAPGEPFGLAVLEAMAAALPVVAAAAGGHLETVGRCSQAALFAPGDIAQAACWLRQLAGDEGDRLAYGHQLQALQRERFTAERQVAETLACYEQLRGGV